jgi:hypothetical protein
MPQNLQAKDCSVGAISEHPRVALRDVLEVGQLGDDTGKRGGRCREEHVEPVKCGMARRLTYQIGGCPIADLFKAVLFVKRGVEIAISFSVSLDQTKYRIWQGRA